MRLKWIAWRLQVGSWTCGFKLLNEKPHSQAAQEWAYRPDDHEYARSR